MKINKIAFVLASIGLGVCLIWALVQRHRLEELAKNLPAPKELSSPASRDSSITGTVTSWPNRAGPPDPKDVPTPVRFAEITVEDLNGNVIFRGHCDKFGVYQISVPEGTYKVKARFQNQTRPFPYPAVGQVTVPKNGTAKLDLQLDTGIR